jgi:hypothetical protein
MFLINITIGGLCFDYTLDAAIDRDVPWYLDATGGAVAGQIMIPAAVGVAIAKSAGVKTPFFHLEKGD